MKKFIVILLIIGLILNIKGTHKKIPDKSIRFRVISNSNIKKDKEDKIKVKKVLKKEMQKDLSKCTTYESTLNVLKNNEEKYNKLVYKELKNDNYKINIGKNFFPAKEYDGQYYKSGKYESLIVTIGKGKGKNFWCALFPPLCFVDEESKKDIEYHSFFKDIIDSIFNS